MSANTVITILLIIFLIIVAVIAIVALVQVNTLNIPSNTTQQINALTLQIATLTTSVAGMSGTLNNLNQTVLVDSAISGGPGPSGIVGLQNKNGDQFLFSVSNLIGGSNVPSISTYSSVNKTLMDIFISAPVGPTGITPTTGATINFVYTQNYGNTANPLPIIYSDTLPLTTGVMNQNLSQNLNTGSNMNNMNNMNNIDMGNSDTTVRPNYSNVNSIKNMNMNRRGMTRR